MVAFQHIQSLQRGGKVREGHDLAEHLSLVTFNRGGITHGQVVEATPAAAKQPQELALVSCPVHQAEEYLGVHLGVPGQAQLPDEEVGVGDVAVVRADDAPRADRVVVQGVALGAARLIQDQQLGEDLPAGRLFASRPAGRKPGQTNPCGPRRRAGFLVDTTD